MMRHRTFCKALLLMSCLSLFLLDCPDASAGKKKKVRDPDKVWVSVLGGPSYTPEASLGVGGAMLMSFKMDKGALSSSTGTNTGFILNTHTGMSLPTTTG